MFIDPIKKYKVTFREKCTDLSSIFSIIYLGYNLKTKWDELKDDDVAEIVKIEEIQP